MRFLLVAPFGIPVDRMRGLLFDGRAHDFERGLVVLGPTCRGNAVAGQRRDVARHQTRRKDG